jgi:hypothetical protein
MAGNQGQFVLKILFDKQQTDVERLKREARGVLREYLDDVTLDVGEALSGHILLSMTGPLTVVDSCHVEIRRVLIERRGLRHFRLIDEVGDENRKQAYPLLAEIEQYMRAFINQAILKVLPFEWWASLGSVEIPGLQKLAHSASLSHPLELTTFEALTKIVTADVSEWEPNRAVALSDLHELLETVPDVNALRSRLEAKTKSFSFWEDIFTCYFKDLEEWHQFQDDLRRVIQIRNKVMHHRPFAYSELLKLQDEKGRIIEFLEQRLRALAGYEREALEGLVQTKIEAALDISVIGEILTHIENLQKIREIETKTKLELQLQALRRAQSLTLNEPLIASTLITEYLIPSVVMEVPVAQFAQYRHRQCLRDWIDQYGSERRDELRNGVVSLLLPFLAEPDPRATCYTLSEIGWREERLTEALWNILRRHDSEIGDVALSTLVSLGAQHGEKPGVSDDLRDEFLRRLRHRQNNSLLYVGRVLAEPAVVGEIQRRWLSEVDAENWGRFQSSSLRILAETADQNWRDEALQDQLWSQVATMFTQSPDLLAFDVLLGNDLGPRFNTPLVVSSYLSWMDREQIGDRETRENDVWVVLHRLQECVRPRHQIGWLESREAVKIRETVLTDTRSPGVAPSHEAHAKKMALDCLLRLGIQDSLSWFDEGLTNESNSFMQQALCNHYACYRLPTLPELVIRWLTERYDWETWRRDDLEYARRLGAIRVAESSATPQAFDYLLNFGFTANGEALLDSARALSSVALTLLHEGEDVLPRLVETAINGAYHQQQCSVWALEPLCVNIR